MRPFLHLWSAICCIWICNSTSLDQVMCDPKRYRKLWIIHVHNIFQAQCRAVGCHEFHSKHSSKISETIGWTDLEKEMKDSKETLPHICKYQSTNQVCNCTVTCDFETNLLFVTILLPKRTLHSSFNCLVGLCKKNVYITGCFVYITGCFHQFDWLVDMNIFARFSF